MSRKKNDLFCVHGPDNAEHEIRKAYHEVIKTSVVYSWIARSIQAVNPKEMTETYHHSYQCFAAKNRLAAERWARTAKHLAQAFQHEAKIAYIEENVELLPYLEGAHDEEYGLHERSDTTADLLNSVATHIPPGLKEMPENMQRYLARARYHLKKLENIEEKHELLRAERIQVAHEYGRALECMALGYEAEFKTKPKAA